MSKVVERFLKYVSVDTKSDDSAKASPSSQGQWELGTIIEEELKALGLLEVHRDDHGFVYGTIASNTDKEVPRLGFLAHMDTSPEFSGKDIKPQIVENYNGEDVVLNKEKNIVLSTKLFTELKNYVGKTLITTDGTTLLGADDKAGIAEIITAFEYYINNPEVPHGEIKVIFTPDEEVGVGGVELLDASKLGLDFAYTVDGGVVGEINYETFNAAGLKVEIFGENIHPGSAKNKMVNSMMVANEYINMLPGTEVPEHTEVYEGFYHLCDMNGNIEKTTMNFIIRDHSMEKFNERKAHAEKVAKFLNEKYKKDLVKVTIKDSYSNMAEVIKEHMHLVENAKKAIEMAGAEPKVIPVRGGTDGARLSAMGLPTPNLFTGGHNFHGPYEYIVVESMETAVNSIVNIIKLYGEQK